MKRQSKPLKSLCLATGMMALAGTLTVAAGPAAASGMVHHKVWGFQTICQSYGGHFNTSWLYNDQGTKWGQIETCATATGTVTCQGGVCRSDERENAALKTANADAQKSRKPHEPFRAEGPQIAKALAKLNTQ